MTKAQRKTRRAIIAELAEANRRKAEREADREERREAEAERRALAGDDDPGYRPAADVDALIDALPDLG